MNQIHLNKLGKKYYRNWLFKDVNIHFDISPKNSYAILGKNGSGKSTFLLILCQQTSPSFGDVLWEVRGEALTSKKVHAFYSLCSPSMELPEELNLTEWFVFHSRLKPFLNQITLKKILDLCGFSSKVSLKPLNQFSSGMKQRIKLCSALLSDAPVCFLDEPTSNLDAEGIALYHQLFNDQEGDKCIFVASNDPQEYKNIQNRFEISETGLIRL